MTTTLDFETVKRIADLARLALSEQEIIQYQKDLEKILKAFEALSLIKLPGESAQDARSALLLEKYKNASESISHLQADEVNNSVSTQDFLSMCPDREGVFVRVPAILTPST